MRQPLQAAHDAIRVGPLEALQKLASVSREALDIAALPLDRESIECQAALSRTAHAGQHDQTLRLVEGGALDPLDAVDDGAHVRAVAVGPAGGTLFLP